MIEATRAEERPQKTKRLGFVGLEWPSTSLCGVDAFWDRLRELGWIRGRTLVVEERGAHGRVERLPALMSKLVAQKVDILFTYEAPAAIAAKGATRTIPLCRCVDRRCRGPRACDESEPPGRKPRGNLPCVRRRIGRQVVATARRDAASALHGSRDRQSGQALDHRRER